MLEAPDTIPPGLACIGCRYDLAGLHWGTPCPECGYRAPKKWPTISLDEAHPAFLIHLRDRFKGLASAQACVALGFVGITIAIVISGIRTIQDTGALIGWGAGAILLLGLILLTIELVHLTLPHKHRRPNLDFPHGKPIAWSLGISAGSLCLLPILAPLVFAIAPWSLRGCAVIPLLSIGAIAAISLLYHTFSHASTTIERCGQSPAWSSPSASSPSYSSSGHRPSCTHWHRRAHRVVAELLRRRRESTSADQPPAPPRS